MFIGTAIVKLHAPWVHSLKEKRSEVQKLTRRIRNKFNASVCEVEMLDVHQTIVLGIGCVANNKNYLNSVLQEIVRYIETNSEAELYDIEYEIF